MDREWTETAYQNDPHIVWSLVCGCYETSREIRGPQRIADEGFIKDGWGKIKGKWYCPECFDRFTKVGNLTERS